MTPNLRLPFLLALTGMGLVFALISFRVPPPIETEPIIQVVQVNGDTVCTVSVALKGGDFVEGIVGAPLYLNPLLNDFFPVDQQLTDLIFDGLVRYDPTLKKFVPSLAQSWETSEDGLTITFHLKPDVSWHDGEPFTAEDVLFTYQLLQAPDFPGVPYVQALWQSITIRKVDDLTISFQLSEPYAPFIEATTRGILPAHVLAGVAAVDLPTHPFNRFPIGTGPFQVDQTQDWTQTGQLLLLPKRSDADRLLDGLRIRFFPDFDTLQQAFLAAEIQAYSTVLNHELPQMLQQTEAQAVSNRANRIAVVLFNLGESGHPALDSAAVRHAIAQGTDRQTVIDASLNGQAIPLDGPYLRSSWAFSPQIITPMQFNAISATTALEDEGWLLTEAPPVRQKEAVLLKLRLVGLQENQSVIGQLVAQWQSLGIEVDVSLVRTGSDIRSALEAGDFDLALVDILPTNDPDLYDFWSQEAIVRGQNYGAWNNRRASEALENGRKLWRREERRPYYDTFLRIFNSELPAFTLYQYVASYLVHPDVSGVTIGVINSPREKYATFDQWYLLSEERQVPCQN